MTLFLHLWEAFKKWRKQRLLKKLGVYGGGVAETYSVENLQKDVNAILKILGYKRRGIFESYCFGDDEDKTRFTKIKKT